MSELAIPSRPAIPSRIARSALIGEGGEGRVYALADRNDLVVKHYHRPLSPHKAAKIEAMIARAPAGIEDFAAWPLQLVKDKSGAPSAVLMPRVDGPEIHKLYSPKARKQHFPRENWRFLILAAENAASAFAKVHALGCVIGDVNHASVLVRKDARVALIDCDSFQLRENGRLYECEVAVPTFTPPELQRKPLAGVERTTEHDAFGLAVLIFHLLFMGRHPFAGRPLNEADLSIEQAIAQHRFAYSSDRMRVRLDPPPHTLPLAAASLEIAHLFERAFGPRKGAERRPSPLEWRGVLNALRGRLKPCGRETSHLYFQDLSACPWCEIERASGAVLFQAQAHVAAPAPVQRDAHGVGNVSALWRAIAAVPRPRFFTEPDRFALAGRPRPSVKTVKVAALRRGLAKASYIVPIVTAAAALIAAPSEPLLAAPAALAGFVATRWIRAGLCNAHIREIEQNLALAEVRWKGMLTRWRNEANASRFDYVRAQYEHMRREHDALAANIRSEAARCRNEYAKALRSFSAKTAARALNIKARMKPDVLAKLTLGDGAIVAAYDSLLSDYLDSFDIETAEIADIGAGRKAKLASFGVETAADISEAKLETVPGFGPALTERLIKWRKTVAAKFIFDIEQAKAALGSGKIRPLRPPALPPPPALDAQTRGRLRQIEAELAAGAARLAQMSNPMNAVQKRLLTEARTCAEEYAQAEADARALGLIR